MYGNFGPRCSVCHLTCNINEQSCAGGMDEKGCKQPDVCHPMGRDNNGNLCDFQCPGQCQDDEVLCEGTFGEDGCKGPDKCMNRGIKLIGPDAGGLCPGYCPITCQPNEILCPLQLDSCDKCTTEPVCRLAAKDMNGVFCDIDSASHNCPRFCDVVCEIHSFIRHS